jgi:hypothetical protein
MEHEANYTFVYKTVNTYRNFEEFIIKQLQDYNNGNTVYEGYLINKKYFDYWKRFSSYDQLKNRIRSLSYNDARNIIINYRRTNNLREYQQDAIQYCFNEAKNLYDLIKRDGNNFVLIDQDFWRTICADASLNEKGGVNYLIKYNKIILLFNNDNCEVITYDNIIDGSKDIFLTLNKLRGGNKYNPTYSPKYSPKYSPTYSPKYSRINNNNFEDNYNNDYKNNMNNNNINYESNEDQDLEKEELKKILLLYAFEQELKNKINNLKYKENTFRKYYLISKDWIYRFKKHYCYNEIKKMIQNKPDLRNLLNNGYEEAKKNMHFLLNKIAFSPNSGKNFPNILKDNNEFLSERGKIILKNQNVVSYWKNCELVNEELKRLLMKSNLNDYEFDEASIAKCIISGGKVIIDLSKDEDNKYNYACEVGFISNANMIFNDEYIFYYDNEEDKNRSIRMFKNDFLTYQKNNINLGVDLESELIDKEGYSYGTAFKIPPHD